MNPDLLRESLVWLLLSVGLFASGYFIGRLMTRDGNWFEGWKAGRDEERTHANKRVIQAKLQAFKEGRSLTYASRD